MNWCVYLTHYSGYVTFYLIYIYLINTLSNSASAACRARLLVLNSTVNSISTISLHITHKHYHVNFIEHTSSQDKVKPVNIGSDG
jgi:hypothetical protein